MFECLDKEKMMEHHAERELEEYYKRKKKGTNQMFPYYNSKRLTLKQIRKKELEQIATELRFISYKLKLISKCGMSGFYV